MGKPVVTQCFGCGRFIKPEQAKQKVLKTMTVPPEPVYVLECEGCADSSVREDEND